MNTFKRFSFLLLVIISTCGLLLAQIPQGINYQAVLRDGNNILSNQSIVLTLNILQNNVPVYEEDHNVSTNDFGLVNVTLGQGTTTLGNFSQLDWALGNYKLEVIVTDGGNINNLGSSDLVSVPYSLYADRSKKADSMIISDLLDVGNGTPINGQVLTWTGTTWEPATNTSNTAGLGISIVNGVINNTGDLDPLDDITIGSPAGGDLSGTYPDPTVSKIEGHPLNIGTPGIGEVLEWDGIQWVAAMDDNTVYTAGTGIQVVGAVITNTGDTDPSDDITIGSTAGGDLSGTYPNPTVSKISGQDLSLGTPNPGEVLEWNGTAWVSAIDDNTTYTAGAGIQVVGSVISNTGDTNAADDITIGSTAGGDLSGTYPNPTVSKISGQDLSLGTPNPGEVLEWNGTAWVSAIDDNTTYTAGAGIQVVGTVISNTGDINAADDITIGTVAGGDLSGTYPNPTVSRINGLPISAGTPVSGEILKWNGSSWGYSSDQMGTNYWTLSGIDIFRNTGNVGVGVTAPSHRLHVGGSNSTLRLSGLNGGSLGYGARLNFGDGNFVFIEEPTDDDLLISATDIEIDGSLLTLNAFVNASFDVDITDDLFVDDDIYAYDNIFSYNWIYGYNGGSLIYALGKSVANSGYFETRGPNNNHNARLTFLNSYPNNGFFEVNDGTGGQQAGMYVNAFGLGIVFGDIKSFRMPHPVNPEKEIWYASLEGPEAAAYVRGTGELINGEASVEFPEHFQLVANAQTMTITLTPLSADAKGLAVIEKTNQGFKIKELLKGNGNYSFDWEVKCVRQGYEDFKVIRDLNEEYGGGDGRNSRKTRRRSQQT